MVGPEGTSYTLLKGLTAEGTAPVLLVGDGSGRLEPRVLLPDDGPDNPFTLFPDPELPLFEFGASLTVAPDGRAWALVGATSSRPALVFRCDDVACTSWDTTPVGDHRVVDLAVDATGRPLLLQATREGTVLVSCLDTACTTTSSVVVEEPSTDLHALRVTLDERDRPVLALQDHVMWCDAPRCGLP